MTEQRTGEPIAPTDHIGFLRGEIERANGAPIQLRKQTPDGRLLFLQVLSADHEPTAENLQERNSTVINIFAEKKATAEQQELIPVGHYNWHIRGETAVSTSGQILPILIKYKGNEVAKKARDFWRSGIGSNLGVLPDYQRQHIASFMLAVALLVMEMRGAIQLEEGLLLKKSAELWKQFEVNLEPVNEVASLRKPTSLKTVLAHPRVTQIISEFV